MEDERIAKLNEKIKRETALLQRAADDAERYKEGGEQIIQFDNIFEYVMWTCPQEMEEEIREQREFTYLLSHYMTTSFHDLSVSFVHSLV